MASAALWPSSVELLFLFAVPKRLRAFRNCFFTDRAVSVKCIFSAARRPQADSGKMPFISTTFPVKSESRKIRRFSGFLSIKIIVPLKMPRAKRRAF